jgi:hypothetical protein
MQKIIILFFFLLLLLFYKFATMSKVEEHYTDVEKAKLDTLIQVANMFVSAGGNEVTVPVKVNFPQGVKTNRVDVGYTAITQGDLQSKGRFHIGGTEKLYILPKQGVFMGRERGAAGSLNVSNINATSITGTNVTASNNIAAVNMTASNNITATNNIATKNMTASNNITATNTVRGRQLNAGTTSLTQTDLNSEASFHINPKNKLYLLPKEGVRLTTAKGGKGTLEATGNITTTANIKSGTLNVTGKSIFGNQNGQHLQIAKNPSSKAHVNRSWGIAAYNKKALENIYLTGYKAYLNSSDGQWQL